jgi:hypothetical protein
MSYKNKTYVIFDGDNDMWAYAYMKGWKVNQKIDFNFYDAHDIKSITDSASEETIKRTLRERFSSAKQVIVVIGEHTKNLYRYVRWELEIALKLDMPIVAVNLNGMCEMDNEKCPPILKGEYVVHVPFNKDAIKFALDNFPSEFHNRKSDAVGDRNYPKSVYKSLGIEIE